MKINQKRIDKISSDLERKYFWWFLDSYKIFGGKNIEKLKEKKVLYLPNHVSHMDYILIPYILNKSGLHHPAIIAGKNISYGPLKKLFSEETGAIFVDRGKTESGKFKKKKEELLKLKKSIENVVRDDKSLMPFIEGGRRDGGDLMKDVKDRYPEEYFSEILKQKKSLDEYVGINIALNYKPHAIERPFLGVTRIFKKNFFIIYLALDIFSFATQKFRKKPTAYVNFGEPYPLSEFILKKDSKGLVNYAKEDVKRLFSEIR